jgi:hypothetical protein
MFTRGFEGARVNRKAAIEVLNELAANQLVNPNLVLIEQREPDKYGLQIRGDYNRQSIVTFLKKKRLSFKMNNDYLIIFEP